ncbi:MAG: DUF5023 domain-containing protein [Ruminococcaceae bacterium]|nr:DUF5023 domain-containing protein [Oscillospiraceae bacterium]
MWLNKNRRKGFTMVELIVVLGIIGVMTAIILPMVVGSGKPQAANAKAKSFYYAAQNVFMNIKTDKPELDVEKDHESYFTINCAGTSYGSYFADDYYFVEAEAKVNEGFTKITVALFEDGTSLPAEEQYKCLSKTLSDNAPSTYRREEFTSGSLFDAFNGFTTNEEYGYYYAIVDYKCRVIATYWSDEPLSVLSDDTTGEYTKQSIQFIDNNKVDFTYVGAFPETRGAVGDYMFKVS